MHFVKTGAVIMHMHGTIPVCTNRKKALFAHEC